MQVLIIDNDIAYRNGVSMAASNKHWIPVSCGDIRTAKQIIWIQNKPLGYLGQYHNV